MATLAALEKPAHRRGGRFPWIPLVCAVWVVGFLALFASRQAPLGGVSGSLVAEDTGQPISGVELMLAPADPTVPGRRRRLLVNSRGEFLLRRLHAGDYLVSAKARAHHLPPTRVSVPEGRVARMVLELSPTDSFLDVYVPQAVFTPGEPVQVTAHGFTRDDALTIEAFSVDPLAAVRDAKGDLWRILRPGGQAVSQSGMPGAPVGPGIGGRGGAAAPAGLPGLVSAARLGVAPPRDAEGVFTRRIGLPLRDPGLYVVACRADGMERLNWLMITDLGLVVKKAPAGWLVYAVDLASGAPAEGVQVSASSEGKEEFRGTTDAQGLLAVPMGGAGGGMLRTGRGGPAMAFLQAQHYASEPGEQERVFLYTDRPVYRPGQRVHFKGIARELAGSLFRVPQAEAISVRVLDPRRTLVHSGQLRTSNFGSFDDGFALSREAATGVYTVEAQHGSRRHEHQFSVAAYRKPQYSVDVRPENTSYVRGEPGWATVEARYFFGAPVAGAKVFYYVMRTPKWGWEGEDEDVLAGYAESADDGEVVANGEARLDARGQCRIRFETAPPEAEGETSTGYEEFGDHDYRYTVDATIMDGGSFEASGSARVDVWRGEYALEVAPGRFAPEAGQPVPVAATVRDRSGKACAGVPVEISFVRREWDEEGFTAVPTGSKRGATDAAGRSTAEFRPALAGEYEVRAVVRDARGNRIRSAQFVWVTGAGEAEAAGPAGPDLQIVADRKEYRPGETASFLINTSRPGGTALVTAEADEIMERHLVPLRGRSTRFSLPITRAHVPNFSLSVCCVQGKAMAEQEIPVNVSPKPRALRVEVTADKAVYAPGDQATYRVRVRDADGDPARAELSFGLVDQSIYAIQEDHADILAAFYPRRYNAVSTQFSSPPVYLSGGDKAGAADSVRKDFPDTALWLPALHTDERGEASVRVRIPDTLTAWRATVRAHTRGTRVGQATSSITCRKQLMVRLEAPRFFTARDAGTVSVLLHNESGAGRRVELRLQSQGLSLEGDPVRRVRLRAGQVMRLDWQAEAKDAGPCRLVASARADNGLSDAVEMRLPALPHGRARTETRSGSVSGEGTAEETLSLRPDAARGTTVTLRLAPSLASGLLTSLEYLAEYPYGCTEQTLSAFLPDLVVHRALQRLGMRSPRLEREIPEMVAAGLQRLYRFQHQDGGWGWWEMDDSDVGMTAMVIQGLADAREAGFPVNAGVMARGANWLLARERIWSARATGLTPERAAELIRTARAGERPVIAAAFEHYRRGAPPPEPPSAERAQVLLALARAGQGGSIVQALAIHPNAASALHDPASLAQLSLAARRVGQNGAADALARKLRVLANEGDTFCHWGHGSETTALALRALLRSGGGGEGAGTPSGWATFTAPAEAAPPASAAPGTAALDTKAVRWLLSQREGDHWVSTRATATVLFALVEYLAASGEVAPAYEVLPTFNGHALKPVRFGRASLFQPETSVEIPAGWVKPGENRLRLQKRGSGALYYTVRLRQFIGQEDVPVLVGGSGIIVQRTYHRLRPAPPGDEEGPRLLPSERPVERFRAGESYLGRIVVRVARPLEHVVIEEPLPAGCEPVDRGRVDREEWDNWWTDMDIRDEQIAFFARRVDPGKHVLEYYLRASLPGRYHVMPTQVSGMYDPSIRGGGAEARVEVR